MRVFRCQECEVTVSLYCRKCPNCRARNPTFRRRSPLAMFVLVLVMGLAVFVIKNLKPENGARPISERVSLRNNGVVKRPLCA